MTDFTDIARVRYLTYDAKYHAQNAARTRHERKALGGLFA